MKWVVHIEIIHFVLFIDLTEDGIEEMVDSLSGSKVQYAFLSVTDPNTNLPKLVLINWVSIEKLH